MLAPHAGNMEPMGALASDFLPVHSVFVPFVSQITGNVSSLMVYECQALLIIWNCMEALCNGTLETRWCLGKDRGVSSYLPCLAALAGSSIGHRWSWDTPGFGLTSRIRQPLPRSTFTGRRIIAAVVEQISGTSARWNLPSLCSKAVSSRLTADRYPTRFFHLAWFGISVRDRDLAQCRPLNFLHLLPKDRWYGQGTSTDIQESLQMLSVVGRNIFKFQSATN